MARTCLCITALLAPPHVWEFLIYPHRKRSCSAGMDNEFRAEQVFKQLEDIGAKVFFEKQLTSSDVSASGRVVVPKVGVARSTAASTRHSSPPAVCQLLTLSLLRFLQAIAEQYLPRIDTPGGTELTVEDAAGDTYTLRFRCAVVAGC